MATIDVRTSLAYEIEERSSFHLLVAAAETPHQQLENEQLTVQPDTGVHVVCEPPEANRFHLVAAQPGRLDVSYSVQATVTPHLPTVPPDSEVGFEAIPPEALAYLRPSRYCQSDLLTGFAAKQFDRSAPGHARVEAVCEWVHDRLEYTPGVTDSASTAIDVLGLAAGVCRDYAHLSITLCRALGIPARYVSAYAVGLEPPDFHGIFEAFLDGHWYLFDATRMATLDQVVRIGAGRDAADVAFASFVGRATLLDKQVSAVLVESDAGGEPPAVSIA